LKFNKIILGSIVALLTFAIFVYMIETDRSLLQLFIGFMIFIVPITFISSFQSTTPVFLLVLFTAIFIYFGIYKYEYFDTLFGLLLAVIIGGAIAYFRIHKYKLFSPSEYKKETNKSKETN
tara:strand:- start:2780 stop:3142 length:363 start_codon:yes stop_codon:yes gene_type:complete